MKYAICLGNDMNSLIGWNYSTDYYDVVYVDDGIEENSSNDFVEYLYDDVEDIEEEIWIYVSDSIDDIVDEKISAQSEFPDTLNIVELSYIDGLWCPIRFV